MDATDINILAALQADGRMTNRDLGEHVGLSEAACSRRVSEPRAIRSHSAFHRGNRSLSGGARPAGVLARQDEGNDGCGTGRVRGTGPADPRDRSVSQADRGDRLSHDGGREGPG